MDPLSAFSLAAGVVQFTDFAGRLLSDTVQVYKSATGQSSATVELSKVASDLRYYMDHIQEKADSLGSTTKKDTNVRISGICRECREVCTDLENALDKLRATGETRLEIAKSSLKVVLKGLWTKDKVDTLVRKLSDIREKMKETIIVGMWIDAQQGWTDVQQLVRQQHEMLVRLSLVDKTTTTDFRQGLINVTNSSDMVIPNASTQHTIAWTKLWLPRSGYQADLSTGLDDLDLCESIRESLIFANLSQRERAIPPAHEETFRWVFEDPRVDRQGKAMWSDFPAWLRSDSDSIYWVAGKPGSGKSTLLKYIISDDSLKIHLDAWAGNRKLLLGGFYFWNAGTMEQKSHLGLLKTLLFECLSETPELVPCVTPRRWTFRKIFNNPQESVDPPWSLAELQEAFNTLTAEAGESYVVALFIDGLDEFSGDHKDLLNFIGAIHKYGRGQVKICVSSRPWPVFEDSFKNNPKLRLEDLTKQDIENYIRSNFESQVGFQELKAVYEAEAENLIHSISEKAHGVFMWIAIVVRSLLVNFTDGSSMSELQAIIDELPETLSDLYTRIFLSITSEHVKDCSRFLQMREHWSIMDKQPPGDSILNVHDIWLAEHEDIFSVDMDKLTDPEKLHIATLVRRKIASRTKGLLEVSSKGDVDYLHRTTHDWVVDNFGDIIAKGPEGFDAYITGLEIELVKLNKSYIDHGEHIIYRIKKCVSFASHIDKYDQNSELVRKIVRNLVVSYELIHRRLISDPRWISVLSDKEIAMIRDTIALITSSPNADVILAAQFCIADYVREKVALDPSMLNRNDNRPSILESAVFPLPCSMGIPVRILNRYRDPTKLVINVSRKKIELVTFLLDCGANFILIPHTQSHQGDIQRIPVINPANAGLLTNYFRDRGAHSRDIEALLGNKKYSSQRYYVSGRSKLKEKLKSRVPRKIKEWFKSQD